MSASRLWSILDLGGRHDFKTYNSRYIIVWYVLFLWRTLLAW